MERRIIDLFEDVVQYNQEHPIDSMTLYNSLIYEEYGRVFLRGVDRKLTEEILDKVEVQAMATCNIYKRSNIKDKTGDATPHFNAASLKIKKLENEREINLGDKEAFDFVTILANSKDEQGVEHWWFFEIDQPPKTCGFGTLTCNSKTPFYDLIGTMRNDGFLRSHVAKFPSEGLFHPFRGDYFGGKIKL